VFIKQAGNLNIRLHTAMDKIPVAQCYRRARNKRVL